MLYHFTRGYINGAFHGVLYQVSNVGWCGVDLFFVLSGFLITGILCDAKDGVHYFQNFYMRRVLRIFPLYYGFLLVLFVLVPVVHQFSPLIRKEMGEQVWLWSYLTNFDYALTSHPLINDFHLAHFWSLAVEEQFYLVWPAVIFFCQPRTAIRISVICIGTALILRVFLEADHVSPAAIYNLTPCRMDSLAVGALCALLVRTDLNANKLLKAARLTTLLAGAGLIFILAHRGGSDDYNPLMESIGYTFLAFFFGGIILLSLDAAENNVLSWLLSCPILVVFGLYSYAIYVFHYPLIQPLRQVVSSAATFAGFAFQAAWPGGPRSELDACIITHSGAQLEPLREALFELEETFCAERKNGSAGSGASRSGCGLFDLFAASTDSPWNYNLV